MVFDIETAADPSVIPLLPPLSVPSNWKDPVKIAAYIAEAEAERILKLALEPDSGRIVCLGTDKRVMLCQTEQAEAAALANFWLEWTDPRRLHVVGYRLIGFDIPYVIIRSRILGLSIPKGITVKKYGMDGVTDLMEELRFFGVLPMRSLDFWCNRLKLAVPEDTIRGEDVPALAEQNTPEAWELIRSHCAADIEKTRLLALHLGYSVR